MRVGFLAGALAGSLVIGTWVSVNNQAQGPAMETGVGDVTDAWSGLLGEGAEFIPKAREAIQPALDEVANVASDDSGGAAPTNEGPDPDAGGDG